MIPGPLINQTVDVNDEHEVLFLMIFGDLVSLNPISNERYLMLFSWSVHNNDMHLIKYLCKRLVAFIS